MVNVKHLATFILGAAAGVALNKYFQTEEGEKALADLKIKAGQFKDEAEQAIDKAKIELNKFCENQGLEFTHVELDFMKKLDLTEKQLRTFK